MDKPEAYKLPNAANAVLPSRNNVRGYLAALVTGAGRLGGSSRCAGAAMPTAVRGSRRPRED